MLSVWPVATGPAAAGNTETDWEESQVSISMLPEASILFLLLNC